MVVPLDGHEPHARVGWELAEYPTFLHGSDELATAYEDTLGDLALAFIGSALAAVLATRQPAPRQVDDSDESESALALAIR